MYKDALEEAVDLIDGFESPFGMELLATVDWLVVKENVNPSVVPIRDALRNWSGGVGAGLRKLSLFDDDSIQLALSRLATVSGFPTDSSAAH